MRDLYERVRESLFLLPATFIIGAALLSRGLVIFDRDFLDETTLPLLPVTVDSSRAILSTIAGATITVAAIVFSTTAVSVQLASSQYSPRVVRSFLHDRFQQFVIGITVGTFVYCLLVLAFVTESDTTFAGTESEASLSVSLAIVLAVASMLAIVSFIERSMRRLRLEDIVRRITNSTRAQVKRHHPEGGVDERELVQLETPGGKPISLVSRRSGWVSSVRARELAEDLPPRSIARLDVHVGEHLSKGQVVMRLWADGDHTLDPHRYVELSRDRVGDARFGIRQLVDIALRALSPGINDPTTATDVIQHLAGPLRDILLRGLPSRVVTQEDRRVYLPEAPGYGDYVHLAFREIRLAAADQPVVIARLLGVIADLVAALRDEGIDGRLSALIEEARLAYAAIKAAGLPPEDLVTIEQLAKRLDLQDRVDTAAAE